MDTRIATAVGGLLTSVFLQLTFHGDLPQVAYLTLNDWIFNWTYFLILIIIIECVVIRKFYHLLMLQGQAIKDELVLHNLNPDNSNNVYVADKIHEMKEKKRKVKLYVKRIERIIFIAYIISVFLIILITSLVGKYG